MENVKRLVFLFVLIATATGRGKNKVRKPSNQCLLSHDGCSYQITLTGSTCINSMQGDGPKSLDRINETFKSDIRNEIESDFAEIDKEDNVDDDVGDDENGDVSLKKLEVLEKKLIKMMEGLSVRSLRHIRQIRNDLRKMSETISNLQSPQTLGIAKGLECPADFVSVGTATSCYRFSTFATGWHDAREYCAAFGADLVAPDTLKESYILDYLIKSNPDYDEPKGWWTAGNYIARNQRWMWTTKHHLKEITYNRWAPQEPNARSTMHCMLLYKNAAYRWHDATCSDKHNFICEIEIV